MRKITAFEIFPQTRGENMTDEKTDMEKVAKAALQATFTLTIVNAYANGFTEPKYNVFVTGRRGVIK